MIAHDTEIAANTFRHLAAKVRGRLLDRECRILAVARDGDASRRGEATVDLDLHGEGSPAKHGYQRLVDGAGCFGHL